MKNEKVFSLVALLTLVVVASSLLSKTAQGVGVFPAGGTTTITAGSGTLTDTYNYAPPVTTYPVNIGNSYSTSGYHGTTILGQHNKGVYYWSDWQAGPAARWDISDPSHPKAPSEINLFWGPGSLFYPAAWGHNNRPLGLYPAENSAGEARAHINLNMTGLAGGTAPSGYSVLTGIGALGWDSSGKGYFGQQYDPKYIANGQAGIAVSVATPSGKFFSYVATNLGGTSGLKIFDITDPSRSASSPYLQDVGSPWSANVIQELKIVEPPGSNKQYLFARTLNSIEDAGTGKANIKISVIDPDTGQLSQTKTQTFNIQEAININISPGGTQAMAPILPAYYNGKTYILGVEEVAYNYPYDFSSPTRVLKADLKIGIYLFDTTALSLVRQGEIMIKGFTPGNLQRLEWGLEINVANSENGSASPMLIIPNAAGFVGDEVLKFYSLKNILGTVHSEPQANFEIHKISHKDPLISGDLIVNQRGYNAFIKTESGKANLYLIREAFLAEGTRTYGDIPTDWRPFANAPDYVPVLPANQKDSLVDASWGSVGDIGLRIDKIDVTSLAGTSTISSAYLPGSYTPQAPGTCTATLSFDKTSVASRGSMTENWQVNGADAGQAFADCGAGETPISAGPLSYTVNNITKSMTCRVYGKIDGVEACTSPSVTVTVGATANTQPITNNSSAQSNNFGNTGSLDLGSTTLKQGSTGSAVTNLQTFLNTNAGAGLTVDGSFGSRTRAVVVKWQKDHNLVADGLVGAKTKLEIENLHVY